MNFDGSAPSQIPLADATPVRTLDTSTTAALLEAHGIQPTQQRLRIAALFLGHAQHCSADEILARVNAGVAADGKASVSKATVYNTLRLFAAKGLVREVLVDPAKLIFDSNTAPHHHIYDVDSGELTDVELGELALSGAASALSGEQELVDVDIVLRVRRRS